MKLDSRIRELIAIGASITAHCGPCLEIHVRKAQESGAEEEEIAEAIEVGRLVARGAAAKINGIAAGLVKSAATPCSSEGCGC